MPNYKVPAKQTNQIRLSVSQIIFCKKNVGLALYLRTRNTSPSFPENRTYNLYGLSVRNPILFKNTKSQNRTSHLRENSLNTQLLKKQQPLVLK